MIKKNQINFLNGSVANKKNARTDLYFKYVSIIVEHIWGFWADFHLDPILSFGVFLLFFSPSLATGIRFFFHPQFNWGDNIFFLPNFNLRYYIFFRPQSKNWRRNLFFALPSFNFGHDNFFLPHLSNGIRYFFTPIVHVLLSKMKAQPVHC